MSKIANINTACRQLIEERIERTPETSKWFKRFGRYHLLKMEEIEELAILLNMPASTLIDEYHFGRNCLSLADLDALLVEEGEGATFRKTFYEPVAA